MLAAVMSPTVSLCTDEAVTVSAAQRPLGELWDLIQRLDSVHSVYYAFMSMWLDVFGATPFWLRLPSAHVAGGTALGVSFLTRMLPTPGTALVAAALSATLPRLAWGGIEARPFIFTACAAVWAPFLLVRAIQRGRAGGWVAYAAVAAVGVAINIYLVMLVAAHAVTVVLLARKDRRAVLGFVLAAAFTAAVSIPLLLLVRSQQAQLGGDGDRNVVSIVRKVLINQFFLGETPDPDVGAAWVTPVWQAAAIIAAALGIAAMVIAIVRRTAPGDRRADILAVTPPWIIIPTALLAGFAVAVAPIYQPRYFTFTAPAAAVLIALGIRAVGRRWYTVLGVAVYAACVIVVLISQRTPFAKSGSDWSAVAAIMADRAETGDAVFFAPRYADDDDPIEQTTRRIAESYPDDFAGMRDLTLEQTGAESATLDGFSRPITAVVEDLDDHDRVWAIFNQKSLPAVHEESEALFEDLGFSAEVVWAGPTTRVVEYSRTE